MGNCASESTYPLYIKSAIDLWCSFYHRQDFSQPIRLVRPVVRLFEVHLFHATCLLCSKILLSRFAKDRPAGDHMSNEPGLGRQPTKHVLVF